MNGFEKMSMPEPEPKILSEEEKKNILRHVGPTNRKKERLLTKGAEGTESFVVDGQSGIVKKFKGKFDPKYPELQDPQDIEKN
jgi:hypothetical protein